LDAINKEEKKKKGPADYSPERKNKISGVYTYNEKRGREENNNLLK